jgi:SWIM zinc finger
MNKANLPIRMKTAVDMVNAMLNLLKMDSLRYDKFRNEAWEQVLPLTPRGMIEMEKAFEAEDTDPRLYRMQISVLEDSHVVQVNKTTVAAKIFTVNIPKKETLGSRFGSCTCGAPATKGLPCRHMIVVAKSNKIAGLKRVMTMPSWWTTEQWRKQFPKDTVMRCDINIQSIKKRFSPDDTVRYCPVWSAPGKKGRPKKDERKKGVMDHIKEAGKKRKRKKHMYCTICEMYTHNTEDCFKNPLRKQKRSKTIEDEDGVEGKA